MATMEQVRYIVELIKDSLMYLYDTHYTWIEMTITRTQYEIIGRNLEWADLWGKNDDEWKERKEFLLEMKELGLIKYTRIGNKNGYHRAKVGISEKVEGIINEMGKQQIVDLLLSGGTGKGLVEQLLFGKLNEKR